MTKTMIVSSFFLVVICSIRSSQSCFRQPKVPDPRHTIRVESSNLCLKGSPGPLEMGICEGTDLFLWNIDHGVIRNYETDLCMTEVKGVSDDRPWIVVNQDCEFGKAEQRWEVRVEDGKLRNPTTDHCMIAAFHWFQSIPCGEDVLETTFSVSGEDFSMVKEDERFYDRSHPKRRKFKVAEMPTDNVGIAVDYTA